jgi:hypothetical protein
MSNHVVQMRALEEVADVSPALQGTSSRTSGGEVPVQAITPSAIGDDQRVDWSRLERVRPSGDWERYRVMPSDLLLVLRLPLKMAVVDGMPSHDEQRADQLSPAPSIIACGMIANVRPRDGAVDPYYLAWHLSREATGHELAREGSGTNIQFVAISALRQLRIPVPPLATQKGIRRLLEAQRRIEHLQDQHRQVTRRYLDAVAENLVNSRNAHSPSHS